MTQTEPWFRNPNGRRIGEIWFEASDEAPLLLKILLTSDNLSVQVHPGDAYAREHEKSRGKTEMWHVLHAEPNSKVAVGLRHPIGRDQLRAALLNEGKIVDLLRWVPASVGDTFLIPAGTIHAIGPGLTLCEVQQNSDVTYRMFDFGRRRKLDIEKALDVSRLEANECQCAQPVLSGGREVLVECGYFRTERLSVIGTVMAPSHTKDTIYVAVSGTGRFGDETFQTGVAWEVRAGAAPVEISSDNATFLLTCEP